MELTIFLILLIFSAFHLFYERLIAPALLKSLKRDLLELKQYLVNYRMAAKGGLRLKYHSKIIEVGIGNVVDIAEYLTPLSIFRIHSNRLKKGKFSRDIVKRDKSIEKFADPTLIVARDEAKNLVTKILLVNAGGLLLLGIPAMFAYRLLSLAYKTVDLAIAIPVSSVLFFSFDQAKYVSPYISKKLHH